MSRSNSGCSSLYGICQPSSFASVSRSSSSAYHWLSSNRCSQLGSSHSIMNQSRSSNVFSILAIGPPSLCVRPTVCVARRDVGCRGPSACACSNWRTVQCTHSGCMPAQTPTMNAICLVSPVRLPMRGRASHEGSGRQPSRQQSDSKPMSWVLAAFDGHTWMRSVSTCSAYLKRIAISPASPFRVRVR